MNDLLQQYIKLIKAISYFMYFLNPLNANYVVIERVIAIEKSNNWFYNISLN